MKNKNLYLTIEKAKAILALKVLAYALGLILAGAGSMAAVSCIFSA